MAQVASNVTAASPMHGGGVLAAPKGTVLPTDTEVALNVALNSLGYISDEGLQPNMEGASYADQKAWGGDNVASVLESKSIVKYGFTLIEMFSGEVNKFVHGAGNVTIVAATSTTGTQLTILDKGDEIPRMAYVFDMKYQGKRLRYVLPDAQAVVTGEGAHTDNGLASYSVEVTAFPDAAGVRCYRYLLNDDKTGA